MLSMEEREKRTKNACPLGATSNPCSNAKNFPSACLGCYEADKYFIANKEENASIEA